MLACACLREKSERARRELGEIGTQEGGGRLVRGGAKSRHREGKAVGKLLREIVSTSWTATLLSHSVTLSLPELPEAVDASLEPFAKAHLLNVHLCRTAVIPNSSAALTATSSTAT